MGKKQLGSQGKMKQSAFLYFPKERPIADLTSSLLELLLLYVWWGFSICHTYLTLRSVSSLNNPQNSEMKICENMKLTCSKSS
jgi:hypothetical protein